MEFRKMSLDDLNKIASNLNNFDDFGHLVFLKKN